MREYAFSDGSAYNYHEYNIDIDAQGACTRIARVARVVKSVSCARDIRYVCQYPKFIGEDFINEFLHNSRLRIRQDIID